MQRKPVLHARDHLPGGADPIPGLCHNCGTAPAPEDAIPAAGSKTPDVWHWWRMQRTDFTLGDRAEPDAGTGGIPLVFVPYYAADYDDEFVLGQPGPNVGATSIWSKAPGPHAAGHDWWTASAATGTTPNGVATKWSITGWFKFTRLGLNDILAFDSDDGGDAALQTVLLLRGDGGVRLIRHGTTFDSPAGLIQPNVWVYISITLGSGRVKVYVNPGPAEPTGYNPQLGTEFPFTGPMAMDTWGLATGDFTADQLAERLTTNGFRSVAVQLNASYGPGHAAYIAKLTADVATLKAAGLQVVGWGEVDGTTGADLSATGVDGWFPQIEGDGQRAAVVAALGAGVGAGLPKAVITTYGGLDSVSKVNEVKAAGIDSFAIETYAELGAYPYANLDVMLAQGEVYGMNAQKMIPFLGTYRGETPDAYTGFDEDVIPNYGIYNAPQTTDAAWNAFGELNGGTVQLSGAVIDEPDPATNPNVSVFSIGSPNEPFADPVGSATFRGYVSEVTLYGYTLSAADVRTGYESGATGGGEVPPTMQIPPGSVGAAQLTPGGDGQHLVTKGTAVAWADQLLNDLKDVDTTGADAGEVLGYTGSGWAPVAGGGGGGGADPDAVHKTDFDAKGDLVAGTGVDTFDNLPIGTDGQILAANPTKATGLEWVDAPSGANLAGYSDIWVWTTKTADANTAQQIGINAATWAAATQVNVNEKTKDNRDLSVLAFPRFQVGDQLYLQQKTDPTRFGHYEITGPGVDHGTWWHWPVTLLASGGAPPGGNADTNLTWMVTGSGAAASPLRMVASWAAALPTSPAYGAVWRVPYKGGVAVTFTLTRAYARTEFASGAVAVKIEKSPGGAFVPTEIKTLSIAAGSREAESTTSLGSVSSGELLRIYWTTVDLTASPFTVELEGTEA